MRKHVAFEIHREEFGFSRERDFLGKRVPRASTPFPFSEKKDNEKNN